MIDPIDPIDPMFWTRNMTHYVTYPSSYGLTSSNVYHAASRSPFVSNRSISTSLFMRSVIGLKLLEAKAYKEIINNFILYIRWLLKAVKTFKKVADFFRFTKAI